MAARQTVVAKRELLVIARAQRRIQAAAQQALAMARKVRQDAPVSYCPTCPIPSPVLRQCCLPPAVAVRPIIPTRPIPISAHSHTTRGPSQVVSHKEMELVEDELETSEAEGEMDNEVEIVKEAQKEESMGLELVERMQKMESESDRERERPTSMWQQARADK